MNKITTCAEHHKPANLLCLDSTCESHFMCALCAHEACLMDTTPLARVDEAFSTISQMKAKFKKLKADIGKELTEMKKSMSISFNVFIDKVIDNLNSEIVKRGEHEFYLKIFEKVDAAKDAFDEDPRSRSKKNRLLKWLRIVTGLPTNPKFQELYSQRELKVKIVQQNASIQKMLDQYKIKRHVFDPICEEQIVASSDSFGALITSAGEPVTGQHKLINFYQKETDCNLDLSRIGPSFAKFKPLDPKTLELLGHLESTHRVENYHKRLRYLPLHLDRKLLLRQLEVSFEMKRGAGPKFSACKFEDTFLTAKDVFGDLGREMHARINFKVKEASASPDSRFVHLLSQENRGYVFELVPTGPEVVLEEIVLSDVETMKRAYFFQKNAGTFLAGFYEENQLLFVDLANRTIVQRVEGLVHRWSVRLGERFLLVMSGKTSLAVVDCFEMSVVQTFKIRFSLLMDSKSSWRFGGYRGRKGDEMGSDNG